MRSGRQSKTEKQAKAKRITAQAVFAFLSLGLAVAYTLVFGLKESPLDNTLSGIGNAFDHRLSFIIWGVITGSAMVLYTLYIFRKMDFSDGRARGFLIASLVCLVLTVLTPAIKDTLPLWHAMHVIFSVLFAALFVLSILLFLQFLWWSDQALSRKAFSLLLACVGGSVALLFLMGLNGLVEMLFFIGIAVFLVCLGRYLDKFSGEKAKETAMKRQNQTGSERETDE